jgi:acetolactate synthase-1/2/3 large subunit
MGQYEAVDALYQHPSIRYIATRHEQATTYMADGYARVSGHIAAVLVVPGPGLYNASAGMATACAVSSPMLVVTGTRHHHRSDIKDEPSTWLRPLTKWAARAATPAEIPSLVHEAFRQLKTGRPRPVAIEISPQTFAAREEVQFVEAESYERPGGAPAQMERATRMLAQAKRPVLWAGGGVIRAGAAEPLQALAELLQAPVVTTRQGKGALSDRHPLCLGLAELRYAPLRRWLEGRDLILAVGTHHDFSGYSQAVIQVDIDETQIGRAEHVCGIAGDARVVLESLYRTAFATASARPSVAAEVAAIRAVRYDPALQLQPQWDLMQAIRSAMPDDGILVQGMTQMGYYSRNYYPVYAPGAYLTSSSHITLGCAYPLALGAKVAQPTRAVVALSGDGGFLYNSQELATAVQHSMNAVAIVFNDHAYGNVLRAQIEQFDGHVLGTRLHNPDFVQLARTYGARGVLAQDAAQLGAALSEALAIDAPTLIEVPVGMMERQY